MYKHTSLPFIIWFHIFKFTDHKHKFIFLSTSKITQYIFIKYYFIAPYKFYYRVSFKKALLIENIIKIKNNKKLVHISNQYMNNNSLYNIYKTDLIYGRLSDIILNYINYLDIILFQILYTFDALKRKIPKLRLNNLNIHNIGYNYKNDKNGIYLYELYNKKYEIPGIGIHIIIFNFCNITQNGYNNEIYDIRYFIESLRLHAYSSGININNNLKTFIKLCDQISKNTHTKNIFKDNSIFSQYLI
jgi:hypothetical protein